MRTILRVGITVGGIAFVVLYPLQSLMGLAVAAGIVLAGLAAGLGVAKWLPRPWYGRQFTAGLRTSLIAVCMAGVSVLLASYNHGAEPLAQLAARSHIPGLNLGPLISYLAGAGSTVTTVVVVVVAMLLGTLLGVLVTLLGAWGKNRHAIQVVQQARLAAQASLYGDAAGPSSAAAPASGMTARSSPGLRAAPVPDEPAWAAPSSPGKMPTPVANEPSWGAPSSLGKKPRLVPAEPSEFQQTEPALPATPGRNRISDARPADSQLTDAMREALATWAADNVAAAQPSADEPEGTSGTARSPQPSAYLNSTPAPPSKRPRKKQNTEWIR
jgi:hypothetical protein